MSKKTITIDTDLHKVVPLNPTQEMINVAWSAMPDMPFDDMRKIEYTAVLAVVPDTLPGVVVHSGKPIYWLEAEESARNADPRDIFGKYSMLYSTRTSTKEPAGSNPRWPLFLHPPAQPALRRAVVAHVFDLANCIPTLREHGLNATAKEVEIAIAELTAAMDAPDQIAPAQPDTTLQARIAELEACIDNIKQVEFPRRLENVCKPLRQIISEQGAQLAAQAGQEPFQNRVQPWMQKCFGPVISQDCEERNHRFLEEALELVQACEMTKGEAYQLVDYVYGRPVGEPNQEVGGVMVTLAALCLAQGLDMHVDGETELTRIWTKVDQIRAKQAAKPKHSPLPEAPPAPANSLAIVQAALDAAAILTIENEQSDIADQIRAIDPQTILDGMSK